MAKNLKREYPKLDDFALIQEANGDVWLWGFGEYEEGELFVVEETAYQGGAEGEGMSGHESWPSGWHIQARKLNPDGSYNPDGKQAEFYQTGSFIGMIEKVSVEAKMKRIFV